jgi:hypothetical protein
MCHCAPVFKIHNVASKIFRDGTGSDQGTPQKCSLPENDAGYAPNPNRAVESSNTYSPSATTSNFEIGSSKTKEPPVKTRSEARVIAPPFFDSLIEALRLFSIVYAYDHRTAENPLGRRGRHKPREAEGGFGQRRQGLRLLP